MTHDPTTWGYPRALYNPMRNPCAKPKGSRTVNLCSKTVKREDAYEVWVAHPEWERFIGKTPNEILELRGSVYGSAWVWFVLKKWQADDSKPNARWFCSVVTPICPQGELGDVYVSEVKANAKRVYLRPFLDPVNVS